MYYIEIVYLNSYCEIWKVPEIPETISKEWLEKHGELVAVPVDFVEYIKDFSHYKINAVYKQVSMKTFNKSE